MRAMPKHDFCANAYGGIGRAGFRLCDYPVQSLMTRGVKNVAIFLDLAAGHGFKTAHQSTADAHHVRDITKDVLDGLITCVHVAVQLLGISSAGEKVANVGIIQAFSMQARADEQKFRVAGEILKLACDPGYASSAVLPGFCNHAVKRVKPALLNGLGNFCNFATSHASKTGGHAPQKT